MRVGRHPDSKVRVVLDLENVRDYNVFTLYNPFRLVIECQRQNSNTTTAVTPGASPATVPPLTPPLPPRAPTTVDRAPAGLATVPESPRMGTAPRLCPTPPTSNVC